MLKKSIATSAAIFMLVLLYNQAFSRTPADQIIKRTLGVHSKYFKTELKPSCGTDDFFELEATKEKVLIKGNSVVSIANGFNYYLKYYCHCNVSRTGKAPKFVKPISTNGKIVKRSPFRLRYYLNYCTFNYTMSFWEWKDWEHELDWMVMNGINIALATNGMEKVWQNTLRKLNYSEAEIAQFIPGPAYQAWWLMGNLEGWGGHVSQQWIDKQYQLQTKILRRMKQLGIKPVFHGFYGMVPNVSRLKFPNSHIIDGGKWNGFQRPAMLNPNDALFQRMASVYYRELEKLYGKAEFYGGDPFHEGGNTDGIDIGKSAAAIQQAMLKAQPTATWVLQAWMENPREVILANTLRDKTLVLDLNAEGRPQWERTNGFNNHRWVWSILQNFGDKVGLVGSLPTIATEPFRAKNTEAGKTLEGIGMMMEGAANNNIVYEMLYEMAWRSDTVDVRKWVSDYAVTRYGAYNENTDKAWQLLLKSAYTAPKWLWGATDAVICARPSLDGSHGWKLTSTWIYYDTLDVQNAGRLLLKEAEKFKTNDRFLFDLVDVTRQVLINRSLTVHQKLVAAYKARNSTDFELYSKQFLDIILQVDELLGTRKEFLLGTWLEAPKRAAPTKNEQTLFEQNARMLITIWGGEFCGDELNDYSNRQWSGLLSGFYAKRWALYFDHLRQQLNGKNPAEINWYKWEEAWTKQQDLYPTKPQGDLIALCKKIYSN